MYAHALIAAVRFSFRHPAVKAGGVAFGVSFIVVMLVLFLYWRPVQGENQRLEQAIEQQRRELVAQVTANQIAKAYAESLPQVARLEQRLAKEGVQADLVKGLAGLAKKQNVKILSEAYEEGKVQGEYTPLFLDIALQGSYAAVRGFVRSLPGLPTWSLVNEASLTRGERGEIKATLRLVTYKKADT